MALSKIPEIKDSRRVLKADPSITGRKISYCKDEAHLRSIGFINEDAWLFFTDYLLPCWKDKGVPMSMLDATTINNFMNSSFDSI